MGSTDSPVGNAPFVIDISGRDPVGELDRLRALGPVTRIELPDGVLGWAVTDQELLKSLLVDQRLSKDAYQHWPAFIRGEISPDWVLFHWAAVRHMFSAYGVDHRRLRRLAASAFTARRVANMRPRIEAITGEFLDRLAGLPRDKPVNVREHFTGQLPPAVICGLFGVEDEAVRDEISRCVGVLFSTDTEPGEMAATMARFTEILTELAAEKRKRPGDDLTSALIAARDGEASPLSEDELVGTLALFVSAGNETTIDLLGSAIISLLAHPDQLALVRGGDVTWEDVIEETLRLQPPVPTVPLRYAVEDIDVDGVTMRAGDPILAYFGALGRDPLVHGSDFGQFDVTRTLKEHMAFGYGVHHCIGAPLARLESAIALPALFERYPEMTLAVDLDELPRIGSFISNGHLTLPIWLEGHQASGRN
jgi:2-hydroxy-5-methyl-1-naphthoate 7-hydroxylase